MIFPDENEPLRSLVGMSLLKVDDRIVQRRMRRVAAKALIKRSESFWSKIWNDREN